MLSPVTSGLSLVLMIGMFSFEESSSLSFINSCIKIWDLASGKLKLTLTGHISEVRGVKVSNRHPYLFSCGQDHTGKNFFFEKYKFKNLKFLLFSEMLGFGT